MNLLAELSVVILGKPIFRNDGISSSERTGYSKRACSAASLFVRAALLAFAC